ncbi:hypothetical protein ACFY36_17245 [Actinoplanes sp. NPDC000266]
MTGAGPSVLRPIAVGVGAAVFCCLTTWLVARLVQGDLSTNDMLASVASMVVALIGLAVALVSLRLQLVDRAATRQDDRRVDLHNRLRALYEMAGAPGVRRLRGTRLRRLTTRRLHAVLDGSDQPDEDFVIALVEAIVAEASRTGVVLDSSLVDAGEWRRRWAAARVESPKHPRRHRMVATATGLIVFFGLGALLLLVRPGPEADLRGEQLLAGRSGQSLSLRASLANNSDEARTVTSISVFFVSDDGLACQRAHERYTYELEPEIQVATLESRAMPFSGSVRESRMDVGPAGGDLPSSGPTMSVPAQGTYEYERCDDTRFDLRFDVDAVVPAHGVSTIEVRVPLRLRATLVRVDGEKPAESRTIEIAPPGFGSLVASVEGGEDIVICRDGLARLRSLGQFERCGRR